MPATVEEAVALASGALERRQKLRFLAGGTDLAVQIAEGVVDPQALVDVTGIAALRTLGRRASGLSIGAAVTMAELLQTDPGKLPNCLVQGARSIGSPQIRNVATVGGNICNASPCGDTLAPIIVLAGRVLLRSPRGSREVPAEDFFLGPKSTVLAEDELLEEILLDAACLEGGSAFRMIGRRNGQAISQVNVAVWLRRSAEGAIDEIRIAAGSVAPVPLRLIKTEALLKGRAPDPGLLEAAEAALRQEIKPISDVRTSERYRRSVSGALFRDALAEALGD